MRLQPVGCARIQLVAHVTRGVATRPRLRGRRMGWRRTTVHRCSPTTPRCLLWYYPSLLVGLLAPCFVGLHARSVVLSVHADVFQRLATAAALGLLLELRRSLLAGLECAQKRVSQCVALVELRLRRADGASTARCPALSAHTAIPRLGLRR